MHVGATENRGHHARKGRCALNGNENRTTTDDLATTQVKPDSREAYIKGARDCIAATRQEKGCLSYESHTGINDPNLFVVVERGESCAF